MKILLTGANGMLGRTLVRRWSSTHEVIATTRASLDITQHTLCAQVIAQHHPDVVVHCAAHTAVDRCENESDLAYQLNAIGSANVARACERIGARLIAISTDYVFPGDANRPYHEWDATGPRTVYGQSKQAGEDAVRTYCRNHVIARVAWLYGPGGPSFVHTMLKLGNSTGPALRVVADQIGNPTSTDAVATGLEYLLADDSLVGTAHLTCEGEATWYEFTQHIFALQRLERGVVACTTAEYPRPAPRPANSRLDKRFLRLHGLPLMPTWQESLAAFLRAYPHG